MGSKKEISTCPKQTQSLWMEESKPSFAPLENDFSADVCIIGAGISGLTCAYTLAKQGKSVVVLEKNTIANGETQRTTAHLSWVLDDRYDDIEKLFGVTAASQAAESHSQAIDYIEKIIGEEEISCDFERLNGYLFNYPGAPKDILEKEYKTFLKIGKKVDRLERAPFSDFDTGPCLQFSRQAEFHILKYINGLVAAIIKHGGKIFCHTNVSEIHDGQSCIVKTSSGLKVESKAVIVSTCTPINNRFIIHTKQAAYRTYVIAMAIPKGSVPKGLYWDTADPYHYIRLQNKDKKSDWLIVGGEDHKTGQDGEVKEKYIELEKWSRARFPQIDMIEYRWSGQVYEPIDSLAFIGKNPHDKNIYIVTGDSGNGITHGTIAGILIPDLINGKDNEWKDLYSPSRKTIKAATEFVKENLNTLLQYRDWLTPGQIKQIKDLPVDTGMILRQGVHKIAIYKDKEQKIHAHSAVCPHLGACLRWNNGEKSWDCPAHGSRFDSCGHVICGPAGKDLPVHSDFSS